MEQRGCPAFWFCHTCGLRPPEVVLDEESGELRCSLCSAVGFVEEVFETAERSPSQQEQQEQEQQQQQQDQSSGSPAASRESAGPAMPLISPLGSPSSSPGVRSGPSAFQPSRVMPSSATSGFRVCFEDGGLMMLQPSALPRPFRLSRERLLPGSTFFAAPGVPHEAQRQQQQQPRIFTFDMSGGAGGVLSAVERSLDDVFGLISDRSGGGQVTLDGIVQFILGQDTDGRFGSPPASAAALARLPEETIGQGVQAGDCAICQDDFEVGDIVKKLSPDPVECPHVFHSTCIIPWLTEHNSCPVCRFELPTDDEEYERRKLEARLRAGSVNPPQPSAQEAEASNAGAEPQQQTLASPQQGSLHAGSDMAEDFVTQQGGMSPEVSDSSGSPSFTLENA